MIDKKQAVKDYKYPSLAKNRIAAITIAPITAQSQTQFSIPKNIIYPLKQNRLLN